MIWNPLGKSEVVDALLGTQSPGWRAGKAAAKLWQTAAAKRGRRRICGILILSSRSDPHPSGAWIQQT